MTAEFPASAVLAGPPRCFIPGWVFLPVGMFVLPTAAGLGMLMVAVYLVAVLGTVMAEASTDTEGPWLGACRLAETRMAAWWGRAPRGRPFA